MSAPQAAVGGRTGRVHPSVRRRRLDRRLLVAAAVLAAFLLALGLSLTMPKPNFPLVFGLIVGVIGIVALASISRLEVSAAVLTVYLGVLDGPIKLLSGSQLASSGRDIVIAAVSAGALVRIIAKRERIRMPPLSGWVIAFTALVLIEAFNPKTANFTKVLGGYRQNLEWVPFFFLGYVLMRSHTSFRRLFVVIGVLTLVNGFVATYQTQISPGSLAAWGPGYSEKVNGTINSETGAAVGARKYRSEGEGRVRPPGLGADSGFPGGLGVIALPCSLALLATSRRRQRWYAIVFCLGAIASVTIGLSRLQVIGGLIAAVSFVLLSLSVGPRVTRPLAALLAVLALAVPLGALFVSAVGSNIFSRYESIQPNSVVQTSTTYKEKSLAMIPHYISSDPFGFGLATTGPAVGFGGKVTGVLEGHGITGETQYNYVEDELGAPGLLLWVLLSLEIIVLVLRWLPRIPDVDIRLDLAAIFAVFIAHTIMGIRGAFMDSSSAGPFFWFSVGIAAYWFAGPGRPRRLRRQSRPPAVRAVA
jgi:hypothetical protein